MPFVVPINKNKAANIFIYLYIYTHLYVIPPILNWFNWFTLELSVWYLVLVYIFG